MRHTDPAVLNIYVSGAKAARLGKIFKNGFPVPEFFVISCAAYKKFVRKKNTQKNITAIISKGLAYLQGSSSEPMSLAVRSSAPFEDHATFSLAGQFKTFLNNRTPDELLKSVYKCWDSMNSRYVRAYMRQFNFSMNKTAMAVLVQKMLKPDFAGVLFTKHPVTGDENVLFIEIVRGIGESLVSGKQEPVRLIVRRDNHTIDKIYGDKKDIQYLNSLCDFERLISELVALSLKIEKLFDAPQDIEWAVEKSKLWILQSRPITHSVSTQRTKVDKKGEIWTDYFFAERFVEPLSPLGWSILEKWVIKNAFREPLKFMGNLKLAKSAQITKLIDGYPYTKITVFQRIYAPIPLNFISRDKQASLLLQNRKNRWLLEAVKAVPYIVRLILIKDFNWIPEINLRLWRKFVRFSNRRVAELKTGLTNEKNILDIFIETEQLTDRFLALHRWSITFADIFFVLLQKFLYLIKPVNNCDKLLSELLAGLNNETIKANVHLLHLDQSKDSYESFFKKYGHRSESLDIFHPNWMDDPETIKGLFDKIGIAKKSDMVKKEITARVSIRENAEKLCFDFIDGLFPVYRSAMKHLFKWLLYYTQEFTLLRENQRNQWHKVLAVMRASVQRRGEMLVRQGMLKQTDDMFFLNRREFLKIDLYKTDISARIEHRKKERIDHINRNHVILQQQKKKSFSSANGSERLEGFGVSKGVIRGRARIARSFTEARQANGDEILIAHSADPAWSPIFSVISGMVLETGGVLSHASIVAREFGLPTVTGIARATQVIRNGDLLEINGESGIVEIIRS
ncbi:hypothetical protein JXQ31_09290 [candidate division KSB1 bacterium]|nr:hypothetical protein [candidate division KSB1 bacterium]